MYLFWHVVYRPCLTSPTPLRIYLSPPWATEDNAPCSTSFVCGLLALPSLTHTLKDLPLPLMGSREWRIIQYLFCMWHFGPMGSSFTHTQWFTHVMQSGSLQLGLLSWRRGNHTSQRHGHKDRVITNIIAQGQTHIKSSQVKCIQNI